MQGQNENEAAATCRNTFWSVSVMDHGCGSAIKIDADSWRRDNAEAIASYNAFVVTDGIPLGSFRKF